jgi:hypothetical protein
MSSMYLKGHAIAQAISHWPLTTEGQVCAQFCPGKICGGQSGTGTGFSVSFLIFLFHYRFTGAPYSYIIWTTNNRPAGGHGSETQSHTIDMNDNTDINTYCKTSKFVSLCQNNPE